MGEAESSVGKTSVGGEARVCRPGVPTHDEGRVRGLRKSAPEDEGEAEDGEEGGPGPP